jgi:alpha-D-ribose 1-methylphosphonate 5-triphosphate synthase subunit PhnH
MSPAAFSQLLPGFRDPVFDGQAVFRTLMSCVAYPGRIYGLDASVSGPEMLEPAITAACLCLIDSDTPLWLDPGARLGEVRTYFQFHCGASLTDDPSEACFAVATEPARLPDLAVFHPGDVEYPDSSTTLLVQVASLTAGPAMTWSGPGIKTTQVTRIAGLPAGFWSGWELNRALYPLGLDVFFTCGKEVMALPRTIEVGF